MNERPTSPEARRAFIIGHTAIASPPLVPELRLHLATEVTPLWEATEVTLARVGLPPPFWAFAWPGGQALARYVLDHPATVAGHRVLVFAAGAGLEAIATVRGGAGHVTATELDLFASEAMALNAGLNGVAFDIVERDVIGEDDGWDVVLAGDVCYERPVAERISDWLQRLASRGATVLMGDPGRTYLPSRERLVQVASYDVPTSRDLEERDSRLTSIWAFRSGAATG